MRRRDLFLYTTLIFSLFVLPHVTFGAQTWYLTGSPTSGVLSLYPRYQVAVEASTETIASSTSWKENKVEVSTVTENLYDVDGSWIADSILRNEDVRARGSLLNYPKGETVTVKAIPARGYQFVEWTGIPWVKEDGGTMLKFADVSSSCLASSSQCSFVVSSTQSGLRAVFKATVKDSTGECGTNAMLYASTTSAWPSDSYCSSGTLAGSAPTFPALGENVTWVCAGSGNGMSTTCTAGRTQDGVCGTYAKTYAYSATKWGTGTFCSLGIPTPSSPVFPSALGSSVTWSCSGSNEGVTRSCSAYHNLQTGAGCTSSQLNNPGISYNGCRVNVSSSVGIASPAVVACTEGATGKVNCGTSAGACTITYEGSGSVYAGCYADASGGQCSTGNTVCRLTTKIPYTSKGTTNPYPVNCRIGYSVSSNTSLSTCTMRCKAGMNTANEKIVSKSSPSLNCLIKRYTSSQGFYSQAICTNCSGRDTCNASATCQ